MHAKLPVFATKKAIFSPKYHTSFVITYITTRPQITHSVTVHMLYFIWVPSFLNGFVAYWYSVYTCLYCLSSTYQVCSVYCVLWLFICRRCTQCNVHYSVSRMHVEHLYLVTGFETKTFKRAGIWLAVHTTVHFLRIITWFNPSTSKCCFYFSLFVA